MLATKLKTSAAAVLATKLKTSAAAVLATKLKTSAAAWLATPPDKIDCYRFFFIGSLYVLWHIDRKSLGIEGKGLRWEFINKKENKKRHFRQGKRSRK